MNRKSEASSPGSTVRATIVQPALAKYRIPVFRELASRAGIDLHVVYGETPGLNNVDPDGFRATPAKLRVRWLMGSKALYFPAQFWSANRRECDVLVLTWTPRYVLLLPSILRAHWGGLGVVLWGHGLSKSDRPFWRWCRDLLARRADCLLFYDQDTAQGYLDEGWPASRIGVAANAIDHTAIDAAREHWLSSPDRLAEFRRSHGLEGQRVLLFVSRLLPENRVDLLLEAAARVAERDPALRVVIIGAGDAQREALRRRARELGVERMTIFQDGLYNEEELAPWFLCADVFCYPENIGLSILHALWYGLPVVTSDRRECHNPEIAYLDEGVNGVCYRHGDAESLADTLAGLIDDRDRLAALSDGARRSVEGRVTVEKMVDGLEQTIRQAGNRRSKSK